MAGTDHRYPGGFRPGMVNLLGGRWWADRIGHALHDDGRNVANLFNAGQQLAWRQKAVASQVMHLDTRFGQLGGIGQAGQGWLAHQGALVIQPGTRRP